MAKKKPLKPARPAATSTAASVMPAGLVEDLRSLIRQTREGVAQAVNSALVLLYWQVGHRIHTEILKEKRAKYGEEVIPMLAVQLAEEFGRGYSRPNLFRMVRFAEVFPGQQIVSTLSRQLSWSHFVEIIALPNDLQRDFYAEMARRRLIALDLKLEKFSPAHKGQMELYLRWLEKHEMRPGEEPPLGLILCAAKDDEQVEMLQLDQSGIRVAAYLTELPPRTLLRQKLHAAVRLAQARIDTEPPEDR